MQRRRPTISGRPRSSGRRSEAGARRAVLAPGTRSAPPAYVELRVSSGAEGAAPWGGPLLRAAARHVRRRESSPPVGPKAAFCLPSLDLEYLDIERIAVKSLDVKTISGTMR